MVFGVFLPKKIFWDSKWKICLLGKLNTIKAQVLKEIPTNQSKTEDFRSKFCIWPIWKTLNLMKKCNCKQVARTLLRNFKWNYYTPLLVYMIQKNGIFCSLAAAVKLKLTQFILLLCVDLTRCGWQLKCLLWKLELEKSYDT